MVATHFVILPELIGFFLFKFDLNWFRSFNYVVVVSCRRSVQNLIGIDVTRPRNQFTKRNTRIINQKYTSVPFLSVYHLRDFSTMYFSSSCLYGIFFFWIFIFCVSFVRSYEFCQCLSYQWFVQFLAFNMFISSNYNTIDKSISI